MKSDRKRILLFPEDCLEKKPLRNFSLNITFVTLKKDAITIKQISGTTKITGGGAKGADDKV